MNDIGVVEDIRDPLELGRARVRLMGKHNPDLAELPLHGLPWSHSLSSCGSLRVGDWVLMSQVSQDSHVIQGKINSVSNITHQDTGFYDPNGASPRNIEPDVPVEGRSGYPASPAYLSKELTAVNGVLVAKSAGETLTKETWDLPKIESTNSPIYPNNLNVLKSHSGHTLEFDDTPGYERVCLYHSSGSYQEMQSSGDNVRVIRGDEYEVIVKGKNIWIGGNCNLTVMGDSRTLVQGSHTLEVEGDYNINIKGDMKTHVNGKSLLEVVGDTTMTNNGKFKVLASRIDLN